MREETFHIPANGSRAPVLMYEPDGAAAGTVLLYHGLGANKEVQRKELLWLAEAGLRGLCVDAPHHGERDDGLLAKLAVSANPHPDFIRIIMEAAQEVPDLTDFCLARFGGRVAISGISLGGFISFAAVPLEKRLDACVPILASPDWNHRDGRPADDALAAMMEHSPVRRPGAFPPCALLVANAGKDVSVPPAAARDFVQALRPHYQHHPDRLQYLEYTESEHMMREQDWIHLWQQIPRWLLRFLA